MWRRMVLKWHIVPIKDVTSDGEIYVGLVLTGCVLATFWVVVVWWSHLGSPGYTMY